MSNEPHFSSNVRDPRCRSNNPQLAALWPVYVSNFCCRKRDGRDSAIRQFFGERNLPVRWWFSRTDLYFREFQQLAGLYDMLVYFSTEAEAQRAIQTLHRYQHQGYYINVLPGREPEFFPKDRSLYAENMKSGHVYSEEFMERRLRRWAPVKCSIKFDMKTCCVELFTPEDAERVRTTEPLWKLVPVVANIPKQRYVEFEVLELIETSLRENPNALQPTFFKVKPSESNQWYPEPRPFRRGPPKNVMERQFQRKLKNVKKDIEKCLDNGKQPVNRHKHFKRFNQLLEEVKRERGML